jgi:hypothetical protein
MFIFTPFFGGRVFEPTDFQDFEILEERSIQRSSSSIYRAFVKEICMFVKFFEHTYKILVYLCI